MMRFAVHQPNFCPWLGFFAKLRAVDKFVILDDVQMPVGRSYVSRSKIRGGTDGTWLTLSTTSASGVQIREVVLAPASLGVRERHMNLLRDRYRNGAHFAGVIGGLMDAYPAGCDRLIDLNMSLIRHFMGLLDIRTTLMFASDFRLTSSSDQRIADIGVALGASTYVSGSGGNAYQEDGTYRNAGIDLELLEVPKCIEGVENVGFSVIEHLMTSGPERTRLAIDSVLGGP